MKNLKVLKTFILALTLVIFQFSGLEHRASAQTLSNAVTVSVQDQNGSDVIPLTAVKITSGETAYDVLKQVANKQKIEFKTHSTAYGEQIDTIGKITPTWDPDHTYWGFFVNGGYASEGVSSYKVKNGDDILIKVIKDQPQMVNVSISIEGNGIDPDKYQNQTAQIVNGASAYDAIKLAFNNSNIDAPIDDQYFAYIADIDHLIKTGQYFGIYINGQFSNVGVSTYKVNDKDKIVLKVSGTATGNSSGSTQTGDQTSETTIPKTSVTKAQLEKAIQAATQNILKNGVDDAYEAIGIRKAGAKVPSSYIEQMAKELKESQGQFRNVTDYEKFVLGITAAGGNATHFAGYNLIQSIYNNGRMLNQGNNGPIYALLAYDSGHYKIPATAKWTREKLVNDLLKQQLSNGSWSLFGDTGSPDITGMAISALSNNQSDTKVKTAIQKAVKWLSTQQNNDGGYGVESNGGDSSESTAQVIIGLTSVGVDPTGKNFTKANGNLMTHLLSFQQKDGGFAHLNSDKKSNGMATSQSLMALDSYQNFLAKKGSIWQFDNSKMTIGEPLPNTATHDYDLIGLGLLVIFLSVGILLFLRKRLV